MVGTVEGIQLMREIVSDIDPHLACAISLTAPHTYLPTVAQPHHPQFRLALKHSCHAPCRLVMGGPGPPDDVLGVREHRVQGRLDVAVPQHLTADPTSHSARATCRRTTVRLRSNHTSRSARASVPRR